MSSISRWPQVRLRISDGTPLRKCFLPYLASSLVVIVAACATQSPAGINEDGQLLAGTWGGDSAGVLVNAEMTHVHVGCSYGDIPGQVTVSPAGSFSVAGSYVLRAYPVMIGPELPATFVGEIVGKRMTIVVTVNDTVQNQRVVLGPVVVTLGEEPRMGPCPICTIQTAMKRLGAQ